MRPCRECRSCRAWTHRARRYPTARPLIRAVRLLRNSRPPADRPARESNHRPVRRSPCFCGASHASGSCAGVENDRRHAVRPGAEGDRLERLTEGGHPDFVNRLVHDLRQHAERIHVRDLALVGAHAGRGIALDVLDRRIPFLIGELQVLGRHIVLQVDERPNGLRFGQRGTSHMGSVPTVSAMATSMAGASSPAPASNPASAAAERPADLPSSIAAANTDVPIGCPG